MEGGDSKMSWIRDKLLDTLFYVFVLSIAVCILGFTAIGGYLYGSIQTAKDYDFILKTFVDNMEAKQVFYFCGYKLIPKGNGAIVNVSPREKAELAETKELMQRTIITREFSKRYANVSDEMTRN